MNIGGDGPLSPAVVRIKLQLIRSYLGRERPNYIAVIRLCNEILADQTIDDTTLATVLGIIGSCYGAITENDDALLVFEDGFTAALELDRFNPDLLIQVGAGFALALASDYQFDRARNVLQSVRDKLVSPIKGRNTARLLTREQMVHLAELEAQLEEAIEQLRANPEA